MLSLQHYLQEGGLYIRTYTQYGPFYFFTQRFLHGLLSLPVTHDAGRLVTLIHWIFSCSIAALTLWRVTRDFLWSGVAFLSMALLTWSLSQEPGHPQETVLWGLLLPLLCTTFFDTRFRRIALAVMGLAGACLLLTKINIGAFYCIAVFQAFTYLTLKGSMKRVAAFAFMAIALLLPRVLMNYYFHDWAFRLCVFTMLVSFAITLAGACMEPENTLSRQDWFSAALGLAGGLSVVLGLAYWQGTNAEGLLHGIVLDPLAHPHVFHVDWVVQLRYLAVAGLCLALLVASQYRRFISLGGGASNELWKPWESWGFAFQIFAGLISLFWLVARPREGLLFNLAFAPIVFVSAPQKSLSFLFSRMTIAFVAVFQIMQVYPVAGSQISIAAAPGLIWALVCIWDGLHSPAIAEWYASTGTGFRRLVSTPIVPAVLLLLLTCRRGVTVWRFPEPPSGLLGTNMVHMYPQQARIYREVASTVHEHCGTLFTMPGFGSFNLWSQVPPQDGFNLTAWMTGFSEARQLSILHNLEHGTRPCVIYNPRLVTFWMRNGTESLEQSPLVNYVLHETHEIRRVGDFQIRVPGK